LEKYHFRRDGSGFEVKEILGTGKARKRKYLAYLRKGEFEEFGKDPVRLLEWANEKKRLKSE
jgi:hypothetical protein